MASLDVRYTPTARRDFHSLVIYIADTLGAPQAAAQTRASISAAIARVAALPKSGKLAQGISFQGLPCRSVLAGNYRVVYVFDAKHLTVVRIYHTRRDCDEFELIDLPGDSER